MGEEWRERERERGREREEEMEMKRMQLCKSLIARLSFEFNSII